MAIFGLGKRKNKKPSDTRAQTDASVSVFVIMDKITPLSGGQEKWDDYAEKLQYPYSPVSIENEEGYVITVPNNDTAVRIKDEVNDIMGLRRAAKLVAAEDYSASVSVSE